MGFSDLFKSKAQKLDLKLQSAIHDRDVGKTCEILLSTQNRLHLVMEQAGPEFLNTVLQQYNLALNKQGLFLRNRYVVEYFLSRRKFDRLEMVLDKGLDFNRGCYSDSPFKDIFQSSASHQQKLRCFQKMMANGIEMVTGVQDFLHDAITYNFKEAFDLGVSHGLPARGEDDFYLRLAASLRNKEMCVHLIEKYGADIERAKQECRTTKQAEAFCFLTDLQEELAPLTKPKVVTMETLAEEVKSLRETVEELTQLIKKQNDPQAVIWLDKTPPQPAKPKSAPPQ